MIKVYVSMLITGKILEESLIFTNIVKFHAKIGKITNFL